MPITDMLDRGGRESYITGPDLIRDTSEKVGMLRQHLLMAQSRHKSYTDRRLNRATVGVTESTKFIYPNSSYCRSKATAV